MRVFKYILITLILTLSLEANLNKDYYFGVTIYNFDKSSQNRIKRLVLKLANEMQNYYAQKINIVFIEHEDSLLQDFKEYKKVNVVVFLQTFYLKNKEELKKYAINPFVFNNNEKNQNQYYLIANKKSNIKSIKDLKNKTYGYFSVDEGYHVWLDYLVRKNLNIPLSKINTKRTMVDKNQKLLLDVYFNKTDFSVVSKVVYDDILLLNPSIKNNISIIEKSKPIFFFGLGLFHKNTPKSLVDEFTNTMNNGFFNDKFQDLFTLLNLFGVQKSSFDDLKELELYYDEYLKLKKSN